MRMGAWMGYQIS